MERKVYRNRRYVSLIVGVFLVLVPALSWGTEPPLWEIYNTIYGETVVHSNQELWDTYAVDYDEMWRANNGYVVAMARFAGYKQKFGYYTDGCIGSERIELFQVTKSGYLNPEEYGSFLLAEGTIGFYTEPYTTASQGVWFSQPLLNADSKDHMWTFRAPEFDITNPEYVIAWEDLPNLGDADYNDLVLVIHFLNPMVVTCCEDDSDCDDGIFCNGVESCSAGICEPGSTPCGDDGFFCNGTEACDEEGKQCTQSGNPCAPDLMCDEAADLCVGCLEDNDCNDGLFCNGEEFCNEGVCIQGENPCPAGTQCNEAAQSCDPVPPPTTTTVFPLPPLSEGEVVIIPEAPEVVSGGTQQFYAVTVSHGRIVKSSYEWKIVSSAGIGSTINNEGIYTVGDQGN